MIDKEKVCIVTPTHDGSVCAGFAAGLSTSLGLYAGVSFIIGNSHVSLARNLQAGAFLSIERFDWLVSIDADIQFSREDFELLLSGDETLVCAEYAKKDLSARGPAQLGMGFALIHRSVFDALRVLTIDTPEHGIAPMVGEFIYQDRVLHDYFPSGITHDGRWMGEDHGFFGLCQAAGIKPRIETRTRLVHWGRQGFGYSQPAANLNQLPELE